MWVTGIIMPAISIFVYYDAGLYADFGINIYYCIAAIYGFPGFKCSGKKHIIGINKCNKITGCYFKTSVTGFG